MTLIVLAHPLGVPLGYGWRRSAGRIWLVDGVPVLARSQRSVVAAAPSWLAAVASDGAHGRRGALSEPLASQLAGVRRPTRSDPLGAGGAEIVLVVAAVAVVAASLTASGRSDPKPSDLVLPLVLAGAAAS